MNAQMEITIKWRTRKVVWNDKKGENYEKHSVVTLSPEDSDSEFNLPLKEHLDGELS